MPDVRVSVVIPAFNAGHTLARQLHALFRQELTERWEIVVADNRSTDDTAEVVRQVAQSAPVPIRLVAADRAQGANVARNVGVAAASGRLLLLVDADDEVCDGWLLSMVSELEHHDCVAGSLRVQGPDSSWRRMVEDLEPKHGFLPSPSGGNCGFRRGVFDHLRGFDERFGAGNEDTEFFWRAQLEGFDVALAANAEVTVHIGGSFKADCARRRTYAAADPLLYKHFRLAGMPRSSTIGALRQWAWLLKQFPRRSRSPDAARHWAWVYAVRAGRLQGSITHRRVYL
jgi:glycosyltransferase involved in cell wall biosynthesis